MVEDIYHDDIKTLQRLFGGINGNIFYIDKNSLLSYFDLEGLDAKEDGDGRMEFNFHFSHLPTCRGLVLASKCGQPF